MIAGIISFISELLGVTSGIAKYIIALIILFVFLGLSFVANMIFTRISVLVSKTKTTLDDKVIKNTRGPVRIMIILLGVYFFLEYLYPELSIAGFSVEEIFVTLYILLIGYTITRAVDAFFLWYIEEMEKKNRKIDEHVFTFLKKSAIAFIYLIVVMIIISKLGIEITPILASLGIGGLAVALALQSTLSNFFSGVYIAADRHIKVGDFVEISPDIAGYVVDIGWRSTKIRTLGKNLIIVPNSKMAESIIKNYDAPVHAVSVVIDVGVSYKSDLEKVEKVTMKVAKDIIKKLEDAAIKDFEPIFRYREFGDSSINFRVILKAKRYVDKFKIKHEFIKALFKEFKKNGIEIPFPQRDVHLFKEK